MEKGKKGQLTLGKERNRILGSCELSIERRRSLPCSVGGRKPREALGTSESWGQDLVALEHSLNFSTSKFLA